MTKDYAVSFAKDVIANTQTLWKTVCGSEGAASDESCCLAVRIWLEYTNHNEYECTHELSTRVPIQAVLCLLYCPL